MGLIFFTNIPAPYRIDLFNDLQSYVGDHDVSFKFEVYFMRITERNRLWDIGKKHINFNCIIGRSLYFSYRGFHFHLNPILLVKIIRSDWDVVLGASWNNPNIMILCLLKRIGFLRNKFHIWSEANYLTVGSVRKSWLKEKLRNFIFSAIDGAFIVPGQMSIITFERWGIMPRKTILLPNLVSSAVFKPVSIERTRDVGIPIFLIVARLEEEYKGILNFMEAIGPSNLKKIILRVAGSGSSLNKYLDYVHRHDLKGHVCFVGEIPIDEIGFEYCNADVFVLPSFSDPSPLSVVEACKCGLPLLISNRCGNHFEAVLPNENGYTFDPADQVDIKAKFETLMDNQGRWSHFGSQSLKIADKKFNNRLVLENLTKCLLSEDL